MNFKPSPAWTLAALWVCSCAALAQSAPVSELPANNLSFNAGVVSEYRYRGISQTRFKPAVQGGADFSHPSGFYLGAWSSTIQWIEDAGRLAGIPTKGTVELDLYAGYKGALGDGLGYDVGYLRYQYLNNSLERVSGTNANTDELYGALSYGAFTAKYSHALSDLFGTPNSRHSAYLDVSANFELGEGWSLTPHVGHQWVRNNGFLAYNDYALTLNKDLGHGMNVSVSLLGTDAKVGAYTSPFGLNLGRSTLALGVKYNF